jgi:methylenetetrahydrofolate reductase (NADPH)
VLNHVGSVSAVAEFVAAAKTVGLTMPVIAAVPVYTDELSAAVLRNLPGIELDEATVAAVLGSADPVTAGIDAAVDRSRALLTLDGVDGVNLSGLASARGFAAAAQIQAEIGRRIRVAVAS